MKTSSEPGAGLDRRRAWACLLVNQLATPGLGTLMARRWIEGIGQLALAVVGAGLILVWMVKVFLAFWQSQMAGQPMPALSHVLGIWGAAVFLASWVWSLQTSIQLVRQASDRARASGSETRA